MPRPNNNLAPCCPICCHSMRRNGIVKTHLKVIDGNLTTFIPKQRWRCCHCNYSETINSKAHNSNVRTGYGIEKRFDLAVLKKIVIDSNTLNRPSTPNDCTLRGQVKPQNLTPQEHRGETVSQEMASPEPQEEHRDKSSDKTSEQKPS